MIKTEYEFEQDFYDIVKRTEIAHQVNGDVYKSGLRPVDSTKEDVVVKITTVNAEQVQKGVVTITIYVPNIDGLPNSSRPVPNRARIGALQKACRNYRDEVAELLNGAYAGLQYETAIKTLELPDRKQSCISIKLEFKYLSK